MAASDCLVALDTAYGETIAVTAAVIFGNWGSSRPIEVVLTTSRVCEEYVPGQFYRRELPCIQGALEKCRLGGFSPKLIVIDAYVTLSHGKGLGEHLFDALGVPVVGVAKNHFALAGPSCRELLRGLSAKPLYITAMGVQVEHAADLVKSMHGDHRIPTLLKLADQLCREGLRKAEEN